MKDQLEVTRANRIILEKFLEKYSLEQLNKVPEGFSNNIIWNIAHVVVTQQLLVYKLSGLPMNVDDDLVALYMKGTKPEKEVTQKEVDTIRTLMFTTIDKTAKDLDNKIFSSYQEYTTSAGFTLKSLSDAMSFNNFHEGIHLGYILALKKSL